MACSTFPKIRGAIIKAKGMVEKPKTEDAPSNLAVIGRYILSPKVLTNLNRMKKGTDGEIHPTDAIAEEIGGSGDGALWLPLPWPAL